MILGLFKKSNIVTFLGIAFSVIGLCFCYKNMVDYAVIMMILGGICDAFDGPIAKKINKNNNIYGIQLDSLADIICSGVLPISICLALGYDSYLNLIIYIVFVICGIVRLAYYNVNSSDKDYFEGIPITFSIILLSLIYLIVKKEFVFMIALVVLAILFVSRIKIKKPSIRMKMVLSIVGIISMICILLFSL